MCLLHTKKHTCLQKILCKVKVILWFGLPCAGTALVTFRSLLIFLLVRKCITPRSIYGRLHYWFSVKLLLFYFTSIWRAVLLQKLFFKNWNTVDPSNKFQHTVNVLLNTPSLINDPLPFSASKTQILTQNTSNQRLIRLSFRVAISILCIFYRKSIQNISLQFFLFIKKSPLPFGQP